MRNYPLFSLCGLNCGLCPRYHTDGTSRCPGCGGHEFSLKHPTCAIITCNKKHDNVEHCVQCSSYPCKRYCKPSKVDSFITYKKVICDFNKLNNIGIERFQDELNRKVQILKFLIKNYNDGKKKNFYCISVNLLNLPDLEEIMERINKDIRKLDLDIIGKTGLIIGLIESIAKKNNIELKLRK